MLNEWKKRRMFLLLSNKERKEKTRTHTVTRNI